MQIYPAIKARMGDWDYYIVRMTMREIAREVRLASDLWTDKTLSDAIQRALDEPRVKHQIVNFLSRREDRFFSSLVVAAIGGNPTWNAIESRFPSTFGELSFEKDPRYFALDGQHRLKAIRELVDDPPGMPPGFAEEQLSVIVVVREEQTMSDDVWLQRYRRLFSSLNRYAKPTDKDTNIIMDEDDIFAIITRRLITDHHFFRSENPDKESFHVLTKGKNLKSGSAHFTSLQTLYEINRILLMTSDRKNRIGRSSQDLKRFLQFRPNELEIDQYYRELNLYWDALLIAIPDLKEAPEKMREHNLPDPNPDGLQDHLIFWPIGQELFASVVRDLLNANGVDGDTEISDIEMALAPLLKIPWELHSPPWRYLLLVQKSADEKTWIMRSEERKKALDVAYRLLCWMLPIDSLDESGIQGLKKDWIDILYPQPNHDQIEEIWQEIEKIRRELHTRIE